jgi:hypothetical protein
MFIGLIEGPLGKIHLSLSLPFSFSLSARAVQRSDTQNTLSRGCFLGEDTVPQIDVYAHPGFLFDADPSCIKYQLRLFICNSEAVRFQNITPWNLSTSFYLFLFLLSRSLGNPRMNTTNITSSSLLDGTDGNDDHGTTLEQINPPPCYRRYELLTEL